MDCRADEGVLRIGETVYGVNAGSPEARYGDEVYAREGSSEKREAEQQGLRGMPKDGRYLGASAYVPGVRACGVL